jgi:hypothetical protein
VLDDELEGVLGLVLCNTEHIRNTPLHEKEEKLLLSVASPKRWWRNSSA